jgi:uncharacterized protein (DUF2141 family)
MSSNLTITIYLIKIKQGNVDLCKFQAQKVFTRQDVLENNINHILWETIFQYSLDLKTLSTNML